MDDVARLREQATELFRAGRYKEAAEGFEGVYQAYLAQGDSTAAASALNDQGVCLRQAAHFDEAEKSLLEARALFQKAGDVCGEAQVVGNLGALCESRREDGKAINLYREAVALLEKCGEPNLARDTWMALGRLRLRKRQWLPAMAAYDMGLSHATDLTASQRALHGLLKVARRLVFRS